jgi:hypothetical protein
MFLKYGLPLILIVLVLGAWEYSKPNRPAVPTTSGQADPGPPPPRNANEAIFQESRRMARESTLKSLDRPWADFCSGEGRRAIASSLNEYFYHRGGQELSYPARWGDTGRTYIAREWGTPGDRRIEQQVREMYERGYLDPATLSAATAKRVLALAPGFKVTQHPCKS